MRVSMKRAARRVAVAGGVVALAMAPVAQAQGTDDLYEVTIRMEMVGMPMQMPAMTQRSCVKKGGSDADAVPRRENCNVTDARRAGNKVTFSMVCTGRDAMTGNGEMTYSGDGYAGTIRMKGKMEGQDMEMTQAISGRRVGACTAR